MFFVIVGLLYIFVCMSCGVLLNIFREFWFFLFMGFLLLLVYDLNVGKFVEGFRDGILKCLENFCCFLFMFEFFEFIFLNLFIS